MILKWKDETGHWWMRENVKDPIYKCDILDEKEYKELTKSIQEDIDFISSQDTITQRIEIGNYEGVENQEIIYLMCNDDEKMYYLTSNREVYLLNDKGQTIERI